LSDFKLEKSYCEWNWLPIGVAGIALIILLPLTGFSLDARGIVITLSVVGFLVVFAYVQNILLGFAVIPAIFILAASGFGFETRGTIISTSVIIALIGLLYLQKTRGVEARWRIFFSLSALAQLITLTAIIAPLTYVSASFKFPMQDSLLAAIDRAMGFSGEGFIALVNENLLIANMLNFGYGMIRWPIFVIPVVLAFTGRVLRLQQFMLAFIITLIVTCVVSTFVPAMGVYHHFNIPLSKYSNINDLTYVSYIKEIGITLDGSLRNLTLMGLQGLVTFPSFHAASAVLYLWALMPVRFFGPLALVCNTLMILGTATVGGHYLIDIIVGIAGAVAAILLAKSVTPYFAHKHAVRDLSSSSMVTTA
jgi:membrane-associated phospholipid phosphatase